MSDAFDVKFKSLPPELQVRLWVLALDADTSKVNLAYSPGAFRTNLAYSYGGNITASLGVRRYTLSSEVNPATGDASLRQRTSPGPPSDSISPTGASYYLSRTSLPRHSMRVVRA